MIGRLLAMFRGRPDPTRGWAPSDEPLPVFDLASGSLGGLRFEDRIEQAEFLGRPSRVENPGWTRLHYENRGFQLYFEAGQFVELTCDIAAPEGAAKPGREFARPRLSGGVELTPDTSEAQVRQRFGPPDTEVDDLHAKVLTYPRGKYYMDFEFDKATGRLRTWSAKLDD
ncbi:MAG TPA: hypothetical protein VH120_18415 [Gemmataceae bacterium]|jgi:hypothetical protein|nr:hypothetical protein [Gemmataceae bacterium]